MSPYFVLGNTFYGFDPAMNAVIRGKILKLKDLELFSKILTFKFFRKLPRHL